MAMKLTRLMSDEDADAKLRAVLDALPATLAERYRRFVGTILASVSDEGTKSLSQPPAEAKSAVTAQMLSAGKRGYHYFNEAKTHESGRGMAVCHGRRLFGCAKGAGPEDWNFGLCPADTQEGDLVALVLGSNVLHVIRELEVDGGTPHVFGLVGEAYVHSWMDGQALERSQVPGDPGLRRLNIITLR
jgi:hypothetical protein